MRWAVLLLPVALLLPGCFHKDVPSAPSEDPRFRLEMALSGLDRPDFVTHAGDGSGDLYVVEQAGRILRWTGSGAPSLFLDITDRVGSGGERGLLGLAFSPDYEDDGRYYLDYTQRDGDIILARYGRGTGPAETRLLEIEHGENSNHNGGMLAFGPDGTLYMGVGDGGGSGDPHGNAQDLDSMLGKILRFDVSEVPGTAALRVATGNPFGDVFGENGYVWAYGLRNPWRFSFDRETGDLWIGDVGQDHFEEIDFQPADSAGGENYGWDWYEGTSRFDGDDPPDDTVAPVAEYDHDGGHCSVSGGYVYRGEAVPALQGAYLFADYCSGQVWTLRAEGEGWALRQSLESGLEVSSFGEGEDGELYVVHHGLQRGPGAVYKVVAA
ncbi:MAG TPA: PQQ-dependent sugar dehydrogenase [Candidatus Thermoplasmatota archaeon]|nr:PQQ-dependent sugar dehydrogenase [Candidatus Thermoplasmatota archaeon]